MPSLIAYGTNTASNTSAATVVTPTSLTPALPTTRTNDDWLFCFTYCPSATPTVATPASWQLLWNITGTTGRIACFALKVDGSEVAPTVTWSSLTTGAAGTPCHARIINFGTGWLESAGALVVDTLGTVSNQAADATIQAGGATLTTTAADTWIFAHGTRPSSTLSGVVDAGGEPTPWALGQADATTSGADGYGFMSYGVGPSAGSVVNAHTWTLTGGASVASSGVMIAIALAPAVDAVDRHIYTRVG